MTAAQGLKCQNGQMLIIAIIFLAVVLILITSMFSKVVTYVQFGSNTISREQAVNLAEAGVDRTLWKLNETAGVCSDCQNDYTVGTTGAFKVTITNKTSSLKTISAKGCIPNCTNPRSTKTIKVDAVIGTDSISFRYAVQVGTGGVTMSNSATINGTVYSNASDAQTAPNKSIQGSGSSQINGDAYSVGTISSPDPTITGTKYLNQSASQMPSVDYQDWKDAASCNGDPSCTTTCTPTCTINNNSTIGPKKYVGNLTISNNAIVTMNGPIYVTGNFSMSQGGTTLKLDPAFGSNSTVLIIDGTANLTQGGSFQPTNANPKGYIMLVTTSTNSQALQISQSGATAIFYSLEGGAVLSQSAHVSALVTKSLSMANSATLDYDTGLASAQFTEGPGGSWQIKKGTYRISL